MTILCFGRSSASLASHTKGQACPSVVGTPRNSPTFPTHCKCSRDRGTVLSPVETLWLLWLPLWGPSFLRASWRAGLICDLSVTPDASSPLSWLRSDQSHISWLWNQAPPLPGIDLDCGHDLKQLFNLSVPQSSHMKWRIMIISAMDDFLWRRMNGAYRTVHRWSFGDHMRCWWLLSLRVFLD